MKISKIFKKFSMAACLLIVVSMLVSCSGSSGGDNNNDNNNNNEQQQGSGSDSGGGEDTVSSTIILTKKYMVYLADGTKITDTAKTGQDFFEYAEGIGLVENEDYTVDNTNNKIILTDTGYKKIQNSILQGGEESAFVLQTGKAPDPYILEDNDVPNEWTYQDRQVPALKLTEGIWDYVDLAARTWNNDEKYGYYTVNETEGTTYLTVTKEVIKIPLTDSQINELKGEDAEDEFEELTASHSSFEYDNAYCDFDAKILVLEKNENKKEREREIPLWCMTAKYIKADNVENPTKYKVVWYENEYGIDCSYYVKRQ